MTTPLDIQQQIAKISAFIETAEKLIYQEKMVDVAALEAHTTQLCFELEKLPPKEAKPLLPQIENLFNAIERLEKDLNMQHDALTERLQFNQGHVNPLMAQEVSDDEDE
ncbi:hypothetical protein MTBPR1_70171 [Candidatus Terasakiella magnetica]|uniref:Uncharacterized protein n=1 Tax=Candidatus Terasakiella magnetica TaxID=1867952 RepID=A0A1C3RL56_9PROT|nr:hypothetical protein [Candidatus Terasakiella magnetica]SCA57899.1 hypothetical protein MTBPR1_70171 [Candidatus Terasakiella magnetica]